MKLNKFPMEKRFRCNCSKYRTSKKIHKYKLEKETLGSSPGKCWKR